MGEARDKLNSALKEIERTRDALGATEEHLRKLVESLSDLSPELAEKVLSAFQSEPKPAPPLERNAGGQLRKGSARSKMVEWFKANHNQPHTLKDIARALNLSTGSVNSALYSQSGKATFKGERDGASNAFLWRLNDGK